MGKKTVRYHKPVTYESKIRKNKSYFKNYETKLRRRRECKTDFAQRRGLTRQENNKYNTPKYRFVVRFTNKDIICQIISAKITGDQVHCAAYSHELPRYGLTVGLTNYSAAYATGLLLARRLLSTKTANIPGPRPQKTINLGECYEGVQPDDIDGDFFLEEADVEDDKPVDPEPFTCYLDLGLSKPSTGSKIFAALKGGVDGGLFIPHNQRRFVGSRKNAPDEDEQFVFSPETMRKYIFGGHVADYMKFLEGKDAKKYQSHFSRYIAAGHNADNLEDLYKSVFTAIRADPSAKPCSTAAGGKSQKAAMESSKGKGSYHKSDDAKDADGNPKRATRATKGRPNTKAREDYLAARRARKQDRVRKKIAEWRQQMADDE